MRRIKTLLALVFICSSLPALGGDNGSSNFKIGIGGGLNAGYTTSFESENLFQLDSYSGFFIGPQVQLNLTDCLGIGSALFLQKDELSFGFLGDDIALTSLQIPVNLSLAFFRSDVISLLMEAGPQFSYRASEKKVQYDTGTLTFADYTSSINIGVVAEVADAVRLGARVNLPINAFADIKDAVLDSRTFKMSTLQITAAILF